MRTAPRRIEEVLPAPCCCTYFWRGGAHPITSASPSHGHLLPSSLGPERIGPTSARGGQEAPAPAILPGGSFLFPRLCAFSPGPRMSLPSGGGVGAAPLRGPNLSGNSEPNETRSGLRDPALSRALSFPARRWILGLSQRPRPLPAPRPHLHSTGRALALPFSVPLPQAGPPPARPGGWRRAAASAWHSGKTSPPGKISTFVVRTACFLPKAKDIRPGGLRGRDATVGCCPLSAAAGRGGRAAGQDRAFRAQDPPSSLPSSPPSLAPLLGPVSPTSRPIRLCLLSGQTETPLSRTRRQNAAPAAGYHRPPRGRAGAAVRVHHRQRECPAG